ncbi:two-component response regulator [Vibrio ishigakensis]|uniref:Two-component response regulator n=1 Tax=Vibrio ishigakensis TaxID=1481914 RepID=A0A0B8PRM5_9VIBR|nr:two-component response regulator [Vibrio ishigakensis]
MSVTPSNVKIVLVDDDYVDTECVKRSLKKLEVPNPLLVAKDGLEALEMLYDEDGKLRSDGPFFMLLDINMPRLNGLELLEELKSRGDLNKFVVFILTSSSLEEDIAKAYTYNIVGYIIKKNAGNSFIDAVELAKNYLNIIEFKPKEGLKL